MSVKLFDKETPSVKFFDGPGRGRKQCPSCEKYVGVRTKNCSCGHSFLRKKTAPVKAPVTNKTVSKGPYSDRISLVYAPAGKCPVKLTGTSQEQVLGWANAVKEVGFDKKEYYTVTALKYYARYFFDVFSDDYLIVEGHLETIKRLDNESDYSHLYQKRLAKRMGEVFQVVFDTSS